MAITNKQQVIQSKSNTFADTQKFVIAESYTQKYVIAESYVLDYNCLQNEINLNNFPLWHFQL